MDIPNTCNPYDATIINAILDSVPIPENSGLYSLMNETRGLWQDLKSVLSGSKSKIDYIFQLGPKQRYKLVKKIAEGGYGQVYLVNNFKAGLLGEQEDDFTISVRFQARKPPRLKWLSNCKALGRNIFGNSFQISIDIWKDWCWRSFFLFFFWSKHTSFFWK